MRVSVPKVLDLQRPPPFREGRIVVRHVPTCSVSAKGMLGAGVGLLGPLPIRCSFVWGDQGWRAAKDLLPLFHGSQQGTSPRPAPSLCGG